MMEKTEFDKLDKLLQNKPFDELSVEEKFWVLEHLTDENTYSDIRKTIGALKMEKSMPVKKTTKSALMHAFKLKHAKQHPAWVEYKIPAYVSFLVICILSFAIWRLIPAKEIVNENPVTVQLPSRVDTLLVYVPADTVFIEKRIHVKVPVYVTRKDELPQEVSLKGANMAEQQELNDLFVISGTP